MEEDVSTPTLHVVSILEDRTNSEPYASCYCEENIYLIIKKYNDMQLEVGVIERKKLYYAVIISSVSKKTPIWGQKSNSRTPEDPVLWDYHVIMVSKNLDGDALVYDFDSTMPFPCSAIDYITIAFRPQMQLKSSYEP